MYFNAQTIIYFDGNYAWATDAHINLYSQTLHYGQGVFEGIRSYRDTNGNAQIFKAEEHYARLKNSCDLLGIPFDYSIEHLIEISDNVLLRNGLQDAYLRPLVICAPNMALVNGQPSRLLIAAWSWGAYLGEKLLRLKVSPYCRPHPRSTHIEAKAVGHYVNSILATSDAKRDGFDEALLLDCEGYLAEGPGANFFFEKDKVLYTPALGHILPGITRQTVITLAHALGMQVQEGQFSPELLKDADSAFYCGTGAEVVGIQSIDDVVFPKKWTETAGYALQQAYLTLVRTPVTTRSTAATRHTEPVLI
jgi:branched-chain amino acid aminotransferase